MKLKERMKNRICSIIALTLVLQMASPIIPHAQSGVKIAEGTTVKSSEVNKKVNITIPTKNIGEIVDVEVTNGGTWKELNRTKDSVTLEINNGTPSRRVPNSKKESKVVTAESSEGNSSTSSSYSDTYSYDSGGFKGSLSKSGTPVHSSGSYTPSSSKTVTESTTSSSSSTEGYSIGGYSGTLTKKEYGSLDIEHRYKGTVTKPGETKTVTGQSSSNYSDAEGYKGTLTRYIESTSKVDLKANPSQFTRGKLVGTLSYRLTAGSALRDKDNYVEISPISSGDGVIGITGWVGGKGGNTMGNYLSFTNIEDKYFTVVVKTRSTYNGGTFEDEQASTEAKKVKRTYQAGRGREEYFNFNPRAKIWAEDISYKLQDIIDNKDLNVTVKVYEADPKTINNYAYKGTVKKPDLNKTVEAQTSPSYDKDGYSGTLTKYVYKETDNRYYKYEGTVTKPASDTRKYQQNYSGVVYRAGYDDYYQYGVKVKYTEAIPQSPIVTVINKEWTKGKVKVQIDGSNSPELGKVEYRVNNGDWLNLNTTSRTTIEIDKNSKIEVIGRNKDITGEDSKIVTVNINNIDEMAPKISIKVKS